MRFRREPVAITADIQQMFYCFMVKPEHRNFLRFFWYRDNDPDKDLIEYRMRVHVFGNRPSPAVATYGLRRSAQQAAATFGEDVKHFVDNDFYVDDALTSLSTPQEAVDLMQRTQQALAKEGNLRLHKITSNSETVMKSFKPEDLASDLKDLDLGSDTPPLQRSLGLYWDITSDSFKILVSPENKPFTRRGILSTINSLFDPLGFVSPVLIKGKIILRELIPQTSAWDEILPPDLQQEWDQWRNSLKHLEDQVIPRCYSTSSLKYMVSTEIHVFSDASETAIAAVSYLRTVDQFGQVHVGFIMGKSKLAPTHGHTIPRLELCAAVLAVEVADLVCEHLGLIPDSVNFYSDSKIVLGYINNKSRRFYVYVSNRVQRIHRSSTPQQWRYVPTSQNPADEGTRSIPASALKNSLWLLRPSNLYETSPTTEEFHPLESPSLDKEVRPQVTSLQTTVSSQVGLGSQRFTCFSSWSRLTRAISVLKHIGRTFAAKSLTCRGWHHCPSSRTPDARVDAEKIIIKTTQQDEYPSEICDMQKGRPLQKNSPLIPLDPYIDEVGIIRVGGRLNRGEFRIEQSNPVILPGHSHLALLLVRHCHEKVKHQGRHLTEGAIRASGYWIVGGKRLISSTIHKCFTCRKLRGQQACQKMSDLPVDRLTPAPPFTFVDVDVFGPWPVVARRTRGGQANSKRWAVLFTCLTMRAIHIELIEQMTSSSFINALRRFTALRGKVKEFRSDRGTNFVGAIAPLNCQAINVEDKDIQRFLYDSSTKWTFNPPHSSHMGGVWERLIGVSRRILEAILSKEKHTDITHEVLSTFMAEVTAIVNARPLVPVSTDPQSPSILSPSTLLNQKFDHVTQFKEHSDPKDMYRSQWKQVQALAEAFWKKWRTEYLDTLQPKRKWQSAKSNIKSGDLILLRDKAANRNDWPIGLVERAIPSEDGRVRKAEVRVIKDGKATVYTRPVTEMVLLLSE